MTGPALPALAWRACCWGLAALSVAWAIAASPQAFRGYSMERIALRIASGDTYNDELLKRVGDGLSVPAGLCAERFLRNTLIVRAKLAENAVAAGEIDRIDVRFADVEGSARDLIACSPNQSFGWLALFWQRLQVGTRASQAQPFLLRSYETGPHELWVQVRRSALAANAFDQLSSDLQTRAATEFAELLRGGAFGQAAEILTRSVASARARFLDQVANLPEDLRYRLARMLRLLDSDIEVPGLRRPDRPWR